MKAKSIDGDSSAKGDSLVGRNSETSGEPVGE